ncbi:MAG: pyrimidine-nucleoside phosphorylase, partial [Sneathia sanguinegens]|nr:pyrimidine-nucleoside phosphorylase [Sneathia sanguinegens]
PLGRNIGNANEIIEGIEALKGNIMPDLKEVVYTIVGLALKAYGKVKSIKEAEPLIDEVISSGKALEKLADFIEQSGGDRNLVNDYSLLPKAKNLYQVRAQKSGYVKKIKTEEIGKAAMVIGAGRATKESIIDHSVGLKVIKKVADKVEKGEVICEIEYNSDEFLKESENLIQDSYVISEEKVNEPKTILEIIE